MCVFPDVQGSGPALVQQGAVVLSIAASIIFWAWMYARSGLRERLSSYALPICIWVFFGTLDILITAKGTFGNPYREGNQLARLIFVEAGWMGPVMASVLWIALWSGIVFLLNKLKMPLASFVSLAIFYSLAAGHFSGFSSWYAPFCGLSIHHLAPGLPWLNVLIGIAAAGIHAVAAERIGSGGRG